MAEEAKQDETKPPVEEKPILGSDKGTSNNDPKPPALEGAELEAYNKLDDAGKKAADEKRVAALKSSSEKKPEVPARTKEEQEAYDKLSDADKKKDDEARQKKADSAKDEKKTGAPEKYGDFKMPEGFSISTEDAAGFTGLAREMNLSQDQAQKLVDYEIARVQKEASAWAKSSTDVRAKWVEEIKADKELGGDNLKPNSELAMRTLKKFGSERLLKEVFDSGWGDHPELFRFCVNIGKAVGEDKLIEGSPTSGKDKDPASVMYPNQGKK